jgi:hypothetical protein
LEKGFLFQKIVFYFKNSAKPKRIKNNQSIILIMAIKPICDKCKQELEVFGALMFSPPDEKSYVRKGHLCKKCYEEFVKTFK